MSSAHILVVDDEPDIRSVLREILEDEGYQVSVSENAAQARQARRLRRPDLVLLDIWMPDVDGITLLKEWAEGDALDIPVIMMSGHGTVETAVEATRLGAYDFIEKPLSLAKLLLTVQRALESSRLSRENIGLRRQALGLDEPIGSSAVIQRLREQVERIATHNTTVFMSGESGTGKEIFARYLHARSPRAAGPFITVNVAGLARENAAVQLFGSEDDGRVHFGSLEQANGGTLLLKDVGDLDLNMQARLISALENQGFVRVGGREPVNIDVRIIAATRKNLQEEVAAGNFRDDLFYHLNVVPVSVPPLREHSEDVPDFLDHYVAYFVEHEGLPSRKFTNSARSRLRSYPWPGNVRELKNLVQRLLILGNAPEIDDDEVNAALGRPVRHAESETLPGFNLPLREAREQFEKAYLEYQLQETGGNVSKVAGKAGIERTHLYRKLRSLGIDPKHAAGDK